MPLWLATLRGAFLVIASGLICAGQVATAGASGEDLQAYRQHLALTLQKSSSPRDWALAVETNAAIANAAIPNRCIVIILNSRCQLEVW